MRKQQLSQKNKINFTTIDVETANHRGSICSIGLVRYENGQISDEYYTKINPEDSFDPINTNIHGISEVDITSCKTFPEIIDDFAKFTKDQICISHSYFDRTAISKVFTKYKLEPITSNWLDSLRVARRAWPELKSHKLNVLCEHFNYNFTSHHALEDAKACGEIMLKAIASSELTIEEWFKRVEQPINPILSSNVVTKQEADPNGPLFDDKEIFAITGDFSLTQSEIIEIGCKLGLTYNKGVTKKTTLLMVGAQNLKKLAGKGKSTKHITADNINSKGGDIKIIDENDFLEMQKIYLK